MNFGSDNFAGAHPKVSANLAQNSAGFAVPYGESSYDKTVEQRLGEIFEKPVSVFYVATGTAANCLAMASIAKPGGIVFAHHESHVIVDECGAPGYFSNLLRLSPVAGRDGKMDVTELRSEVERVAALTVHGGRPNAIAVTQPTESGTVYSLDELDQIAAIAKKHSLPLLMDGARFANGLVSLGCSPAEMTWKRGVDILSFGGTKNGCWCAEAVILFDVGRATDFAFYQKRAGQLFSKSRFVTAQLEAYLQDDLWLDLARHSNKMGAMLYGVLRKSNAVKLFREPQTNEIFVIIKKTIISHMESKGVVFMDWPTPPEVQIDNDELVCRFVTNFTTQESEIHELGNVLMETT